MTSSDTIGSDHGWFNEPRLEVLLLHPLVKTRVDRYAASATQRMTGEEFLGAIGKIGPWGVATQLGGRLVSRSVKRGVSASRSPSGDP